MIEFTALQDFWSEEARSQYCAGMSYAADNDELRVLVLGWIFDKKVALGRASDAQISGEGAAE